ncbi:disintegrin and metalloproteinase domain-containing protein 30 [Pteropus medius]|uniref:disintegrin and metalloproteinase domain-containing protein 30 n=1 Tax=Pteropus vampyrus TaxID=132908 RepID=UPI00196B7270|nr:disintegrin and metalloproteinase domain-containing protein 30 [Pteropus giganteus]
MRSARPLLSHGRPLPVLVLAALLVVDCLGKDLIFHPEWGFDSYEIAIPKKLSFRGGEPGVAKHLLYLLQVQGKKHVLHLWPKRFLLPRHLPVFSFTDGGELLEDHPYVPRDCNFMGLLEDVEDSEATFSTCSGGLRGVLKIDAQHYQIEPLQASSSFEHVVYHLKDEEFQNPICGLTGDDREQEMAQHEDVARVRGLRGPPMHQKYLELALIFDHERYLFSNSNLTSVINDAVLLTSIVDTYFQELRLRIQLSTIEVWTEQDKVNLSLPQLQQVLNQFLVYQRRVLSVKYSVDWTHLYIKRRYPDAFAGAWGKVCTKKKVGSVNIFPDVNILVPATYTAHNLGHSVGMEHDVLPYCQCKGRHDCIMGIGRNGFSNCSYIQFFNHVHKGADCLNNIPDKTYVVQRCGNKIVEENEECDCGSLEDCKGDQCCEPDCKFKHGVNCSTGLCCHNCHLRPSGYICRKEENECDLAEYCDGASNLCPNDTYKQDGTPCKYEAHCFRKGCRSTYMQCQNIFGPDAREAAHQCFEVVNLIGDQYGNCGIMGTKTYIKCTKQHSLCGRIQCINVRVLPDMPDHTTITSTHLQDENLMCWSIGYHLSLVALGIPDLGVINDGTSCGKDQICVNRTCMSKSILNFDCLPEKCNHRGFCNNNRNCHCMYGWEPPFCEEMGYGGSIDSGPPGPLKLDLPDSVKIVFLIFLRFILLAISVIIVIFRRLIRSYLQPQQKETPPPVTAEEPPKEKTV